jgi:hypothetical protein
MDSRNPGCRARSSASRASSATTAGGSRRAQFSAPHCPTECPTHGNGRPRESGRRQSARELRLLGGPPLRVERLEPLPLRGLALPILERLGVDVGRRRRLGVAEPGRDLDGVFARGDERASRRVPALVEDDSLQRRPLRILPGLARLPFGLVLPGRVGSAGDGARGRTAAPAHGRSGTRARRPGARRSTQGAARRAHPPSEPRGGPGRSSARRTPARASTSSFASSTASSRRRRSSRSERSCACLVRPPRRRYSSVSRWARTPPRMRSLASGGYPSRCRWS